MAIRIRYTMSDGRVAYQSHDYVDYPHGTLTEESARVNINYILQRELAIKDDSGDYISSRHIIFARIVDE